MNMNNENMIMAIFIIAMIAAGFRMIISGLERKYENKPRFKKIKRLSSLFYIVMMIVIFAIVAIAKSGKDENSYVAAVKNTTFNGVTGTVREVFDGFYGEQNGMQRKLLTGIRIIES